MKKRPLYNKLKAKHKCDNVVLKELPTVGAVEEDLKNQRIKKQFAQDALIYQRMKCPFMALACCLIYQV